MPEGAKKAIQGLLQTDPSKRLGLEETLFHLWKIVKKYCIRELETITLGTVLVFHLLPIQVQLPVRGRTVTQIKVDQTLVRDANLFRN